MRLRARERAVSLKDMVPPFTCYVRQEQSRRMPFGQCCVGVKTQRQAANVGRPQSSERTPGLEDECPDFGERLWGRSLFGLRREVPENRHWARGTGLLRHGFAAIDEARVPGESPEDVHLEPTHQELLDLTLPRPRTR